MISIKRIIACLLLLFPCLSWAQGDPLTCVGYPEPRIFLEAQAWWQARKVAFPGKHIHVGTCFPLEQLVSGVLHFDVQIMLHGMQGNGVIKNLFMDIRDPGSKSNGIVTTIPIDLSCAASDCTWIVPADIDTDRDLKDGVREFHFKVEVPETAEGDDFYASTFFDAVLNNGKPESSPPGPMAFRSPGGTGFYSGAKYQRMACPADGYEFVAAVQSGTATITCNFARQTAFASIDPSFHAVPPDPGLVILDSPTGGEIPISFDTRMLANGSHKLFLRTDAAGTNPTGTASGILVLPFTVSN